MVGFSKTVRKVGVETDLRQNMLTWYFFFECAVPMRSWMLLGTRVTSVEEYRCLVSISELSPSCAAYLSTPLTTQWRPRPETAWKLVHSPCRLPPSSCAEEDAASCHVQCTLRYIISLVPRPCAFVASLCEFRTASDERAGPGNEASTSCPKQLQ